MSSAHLILQCELSIALPTVVLYADGAFTTEQRANMAMLGLQTRVCRFALY